MAKFCPLASSSGGNSTYLGASGGALLIDAGISCRRIETALAAFDDDADRVAAVLLTHEHIDHVKGLPVFLRRHPEAVLYATAAVLEDLAPSLPAGCATEAIVPGEIFTAAGVEVRVFATPHDSVGSVGYRMETPDGRTFAVATDLGAVTDEVRAALLGTETVLLESNYDPLLLRMGPYPPYLKARIASEHGHLSNDDAASFAAELIEAGTARFFLGHLSRENNNPALAQQTVCGALAQAGARQGADFELAVAPYDCPGRLVRL